jgi:hypothetical protein
MDRAELALPLGGVESVVLFFEVSMISVGVDTFQNFVTSIEDNKFDITEWNYMKLS